MVAEACCTHISFNLCGYGCYILAVSACKFNNQYSAGVALYKKAVLSLFNIVFGAFKDIMINQFACTWFVM